MNKQQQYDMRMIYDYNKIQSDLTANKNRVKLISNKIEEMNKDVNYKCLYPIIEDLDYIVQSLDYIYISCVSRNGVRVSFFPYTKFYREIISTIKVLDDKIKDIFKENNLFANSINNDYQNIKVFMQNEFQWRNDLEHDIDPFFDGEIFNIIDELDIDKIVKFAELICDLIEKIKLIGIKVINLRGEIVNYKVLSLEDRKKIISECGNKYKKILEMVTQLSHISMKNNGLSEEGKNIADLTFKYMELNKAFSYTYKPSNTIDKPYTNVKRDDYSYFIRMSITTYYQIFDKLGMYLDNKLGLNLRYSYYKTVVDEIVNKNLVSDEIIKSICELRNGDEYNELSRIRQKIVHYKKVFIDFRSNTDASSSLLVSSISSINNIIYIILDNYFKINSIKVSQSVINEVNSIISIRKL